ncbi:hypothetical protein ACXZ1K_06595 [Pedobacter sp. PWIIR3]
MLKYNWLFVIFLSFFINTKAQHPPVFEGMRTDTTKIVWNNLRVNLVKYSYGKPNINFLAIHDDEDTGVKAAFEYIQFSGGSIIDCQYGNGRNFKFSHNGNDFITDPNSIYTYEGLVTRLFKFGNADNDQVLKQLENVSKTILETYDASKQGYFFTLHNNADGGFGVSSYLKGNEMAAAADSVCINPFNDPDDLIFVTDLKLFNRLKRENINVVLQAAEVPDDGSLSVYAMQKNIPYVNVEVQHGHQDEHLRLIEIAVKALYETYPQIKEKAAK